MTQANGSHAKPLTNGYSLTSKRSAAATSDFAVNFSHYIAFCGPIFGDRRRHPKGRDEIGVPHLVQTVNTEIEPEIVFG